MENQNKEPDDISEMIWMYIEDWEQYEANRKEVQKLLDNGGENEERNTNNG